MENNWINLKNYLEIIQVLEFSKKEFEFEECSLIEREV